MKNLIFDILLYDFQRPEETRIELRVPVSDDTAARLLHDQRTGLQSWDALTLSNLATSIGNLNGLRGVPLRVREVEK